jgi:hypothetical protein
MREDFQNNANLFVPSVVEFLEENKLDGFDIDDEGIGFSEVTSRATGWIARLTSMK